MSNNSTVSSNVETLGVPPADSAQTQEGTSEDDVPMGPVHHPTSSSFTGTLIEGRMEGKGEFLFPTGTKYIGDFKNGMFHGHGILYFTNGGKFEAEWEEGRAVGEGTGGKYTFKDGLEHQEHNWGYCTLADRRFYSEICNGIKPAGRTQMTDRIPPPTIPLGWYDCGDGIYNPEKRVVYTYNNAFLRNADMDEHDWILKTCRKGVTPSEQLTDEGLFSYS